MLIIYMFKKFTCLKRYFCLSGEKKNSVSRLLVFHGLFVVTNVLNNVKEHQIKKLPNSVK